MTCVHRCFLLTIVSLWLTFGAHAQAAASSASSSVLAPNSATIKSGVVGKPKTSETPPKHFIKAYPLVVQANLLPATGSCFSGPLQFPASNATDVAKLLASEPDFTLTAIAPDRIAIYYKSSTAPAADVNKIEQHIDDLASPEFRNATAILIPSGSAEKIITQLTLPGDGSLVVRAVADNCVLILSKDQADPITTAALRNSISGMYRRQTSAAPTQRLFYIDATTVAKKLTGAGDSSENTGGKDTASKSTPSPSPGGQTATATSSVSPTVSVSVAPGASPGTAKATGDDSPDSTQGNALSKNTDKSDSATKESGKPTDTAGKTIVAPKAAKAPTMQPVNDMLVYSNEDGSDRGISERNRLMAVLDLPRPEVLMNIWSLQTSSGDYKIVTAGAEAARQLISHHNDLLQNSLDRGWNSLSRQMKEPGFFYEPFYRYVTQKFAESDSLVLTLEKHGAEPPIEDITSHPSVTESSDRKRWGWCEDDQYCLGFSRAFEPLRPTLTNILIGIIAARNSCVKAEKVVNEMEGSQSVPNTPVCKRKPSAGHEPCADEGTVKAFHACIADNNRNLHTFKAQSNDCALNDRIVMSEQLLNDEDENLQLNCFREQARVSFSEDNENATTRVGLLRAAVADFLFNYKWATQYPHDFVPYDLTQSAQELNAEFNPLVLAFNRDVAAFTENLQAELQCKYEADISRRESRNWFRRGDRTFINDGMLSVRGISNLQSLVDTVTQSFFDATNPPSLTDLVKSVSDAEKNTPGVLKTNLTANEAAVLLGALNSVQPAEAKIGRELKLDITPHALAGASSAELEVKLTAEEAGNPTRFTASKSAEDTLSRIAKHDVSTRVRVESLKLFEVSAFSAMLERPRSKFPIVPPFFEVPYFGSFIGWPLPGAKVYHRSTAVVSAVIVPTAADLAFGIDFSADRFCEASGCFRANSPRDFGSLPLRNFHKAIIQCFASGGQTAYTGLLSQSPELARGRLACENLALFESKAVRDRGTAPSTVPPTD